MLRRAAAAFLLATSPAIAADEAIPCRVFADQIKASLLVPRAEGAMLGLKPVARMFFGDDAARATGLRFVLFSDALNTITIEDREGRRVSAPYGLPEKPLATGAGAAFCSVSGQRLRCSFGAVKTDLSYQGERIDGVIAQVPPARKCRLAFPLE